jgi:hypothetical protein
MVSALFINDVPIECVNQAAIVYHIPATLLISVLKVEGGRAGMAKKNTNGTYDYGPMQINSVWLNSVRPYGFSKERIQFDACTNMWVGAWILSKKIAESPSLWRGIANYHSYTENKNIPYQYKVWNTYQVLTNYISKPGQ